MYQETSILMHSIYEQAEASDAHCHLALFSNPREIIEEAVRNGISTIVAAGGSIKENEAIAEIVKSSNVFGVVGISPEFVAEWKGKDAIALIIKSNRNIVGIGEVGLDFKIAKSREEVEMQKKVFEEQIELSVELDVPLVIHSRLALHEVVEMLKTHSAKRAMFHFFEGDEKDALELEKLGYLISIPPVESKKRNRAIAAVGISTILVETDSPVVGKSPVEVKKSIELVAKAKNMGIAEVAEETTKNLKELFYI